jgi:SAM-dependent methyltransferase
VSPDFPCVICQHASQRLFEVSGYWIRQCDSCGHQFAELSDVGGHVQRQYGDRYFTGGGAGYTNYLQEEPLLVHRGRWYARRIARYCGPGAVCDVGAAAGFTLVGFREAGWEPFGIEPNAKMAEYARQRLNIRVEAVSLEEWQPTCAFDLVLMLQVLPHFVDPGRALRKAALAVRAGGHLLIETWDRSSWTARLFGTNWHEYSPPSVLHWFSRAGLVRLAAAAGFKQVATGRPSKWINAGHAKSVLEQKAASSLANRLALGVARLIPDRVAIPYMAEDLFWALFRRADGSGSPDA